MSKRSADYVLYIVIAIVFVALLIWDAGRVRTPISQANIKWFGLALQTPILFGYATIDHRRCWKRLSFWGVMTALLLTHLGIYLVLLTRVETWSPLWFVAFFPLENIAIDGVLVASGQAARGKRL